MGRFIEGLRRNGVQQAQREADRILEAARRKQFYESGLLGILNEVIAEKGAEAKYVDPADFDRMIYWKFDVGHPDFYAELHIQNKREYDGALINGGHEDKITRKYVSISTDKDGSITFRGARISGQLGSVEGFAFGTFVELPIIIKVPKAEWSSNREVLEDALGKVCRHPRKSEKTEIVDSPFFDSPAFARFREAFHRENSESKD
jgi:hypothetical protein